MIRLLGNLLENAVSYGNPGGHVWVSAWKADEYLRVLVKDDGIGISPQDLPRIWGPVFTRRTLPGIPIAAAWAFSMVKWIVEAHHGQISVSSELGKGTAFSCIFPIRRLADIL